MTGESGMRQSETAFPLKSRSNLMELIALIGFTKPA
jgi:hypothetical protein